MADLPLVSVIIPMRNCEKHVEGLMSMLLKQTFEDFEVICVDDGSTDETIEKAHLCCAADKRCVVLSQEHAGAGAARNTGMEKARGVYLVFLDADDAYCPNLLEDMVSAAEEFRADEVFCLFDEYNYRTHEHHEGLGFDKSAFPHRIPVATVNVEDLYRKTSWWCPNTLFRKELVDRHNLRFSTTQVANDEFFMRAYASVATTMVGLHTNLLTYRRYFDEQSLTSTRGKHTEDETEALLALYGWLREQGLYERHKEAFLNYFIHSIHYNGSFPYRPRYIESVVDAMCGKGLFRHLDERTFYHVYWKRYDKEKMRMKIADLQSKDPLDLQGIEAWTNRLATIQGIEKLARKKYGCMLVPGSAVGSKFKAVLAGFRARWRKPRGG